MHGSGPLNRLAVMVTRPVRQAAGFCDLIGRYGGQPVAFPTLEVQALSNESDHCVELRALEHYDWLVFISANAVYFALQACDNELAVPGGLKIAAIGKATARALEAAGVAVDLVPEHGFNSEEFLALPEMRQVDRQVFLIVRGQGGRDQLAKGLRRRGARVCYLEVYRRASPEVNIERYLPHWRNGGIDAVTIFSGESLSNFIAILGAEGLTLFANIPMVVASARIAGQAKNSGFNKVIVAANASERAFIDSLIQLAESNDAEKSGSNSTERSFPASG